MRRQTPCSPNQPETHEAAACFQASINLPRRRRQQSAWAQLLHGQDTYLPMVRQTLALTLHRGPWDMENGRPLCLDTQQRRHAVATAISEAPSQTAGGLGAGGQHQSVSIIHDCATLFSIKPVESQAFKLQRQVQQGTLVLPWRTTACGGPRGDQSVSFFPDFAIGFSTSAASPRALQYVSAGASAGCFEVTDGLGKEWAAGRQGASPAAVTECFKAAGRPRLRVPNLNERSRKE